MKQPHIIIFNPDQMRADSLAHLGNPASITPNLDRFAREEAVSFRNAFCQNPVCVPSRCSFTTGLYPHVHGHRTMSYLLRPGETSIFQELKNAGYYVWMNARNDLVAGQYPGLVESHASEIFYGGDVPAAPGPAEKTIGGSGSHGFYAMFGGRLGLDAQGKNYTRDDEDLDAAIERIRHAPEDKPLCLFLGLQLPHPPYQVEEPYYSAIDRAKLPPRRQAREGVGKPVMEALIRENQNLQDYTEQEWSELRGCYLGMCMKADWMFGKLCDALKEAGIYDDSVIFFFSDHGDYTGDYGISEKAQNTFEDCLTNVPFLIKPPKGEPVDPGICDGLVELVDFYATAMDYASVSPTHSHFGRSLRGAVGDRSAPLREFVCCEGGRLPEERHCDEFHANGPNGTSPQFAYWPRHFAQTDPVAHSKGIMLRNARYKYVARLEGGNEFYDLRKDPAEQYNCIQEETYASRIAVMRDQLMRWQMATADVVPLDLDRRFSNEMVWAMVKNLVPAEYEEAIRQKIRNGAHPFGLIQECRKRFVD